MYTHRVCVNLSVRTDVRLDEDTAPPPPKPTTTQPQSAGGCMFQEEWHLEQADRVYQNKKKFQDKNIQQLRGGGKGGGTLFGGGKCYTFPS